jgi:hypothetical protein
MTNDDEGQYWAEMQGQAAAHEAEQAAADAAEYEQEMEREKNHIPDAGKKVLAERWVIVDSLGYVMLSAVERAERYAWERVSESINTSIPRMKSLNYRAVRVKLVEVPE